VDAVPFPLLPRAAKAPGQQRFQSIQGSIRQRGGDLPANNLAKTVTIETIIDRARLRPQYGQGWTPGGM
jgi:hypothetical protein